MMNDVYFPSRIVTCIVSVGFNNLTCLYIDRSKATACVYSVTHLKLNLCHVSEKEFRVGGRFQGLGSEITSYAGRSFYLNLSFLNINCCLLGMELNPLHW